MWTSYMCSIFSHFSVRKMGACLWPDLVNSVSHGPWPRDKCGVDLLCYERVFCYQL